MACKQKTWLWNLDDYNTSDIMTSTARAMMEEGAKPKRRICLLERKLVNFSSFNMDDPRYGVDRDVDELHQPLVTTYMRTFTAPYAPRCKPLTPKENTPDTLFNRLPLNDFETKAHINYKFLDDHMHNITEVRERINFFRQLRNQSFVVY
ncbi:uncharacterized protein LOC115631877 [Scaptodrosophila lebanonensis]|uniref:Uncharacterized protein LOC115631877 n=1 Tax=Drosophila lebanonensis TaxID=7225 RepID=A0A6J2U9B0_DROLE|nr:uncharacterized protein LOC115631877 [Scaptodrosophila lebanonensis]